MRLAGGVLKGLQKVFDHHQSLSGKHMESLLRSLTADALSVPCT